MKRRKATIEKIIMETDEAITKLDVVSYPPFWEPIVTKESDTNALKSQAYDQIKKLLLKKKRESRST